MKTTLQISDDTGFLALANPERYSAFVDPDWEPDQLIEHFLLEMNDRNLIIWATGLAKIWSVTITDSPSPMTAFREFTQRIEVTAGRLYLTNYEDLTMAAQFEDQSIPSPHNADKFVVMPNGAYDLTVRQIGDPSDLKLSINTLSFEIVVQAAATSMEEITNIPWFPRD